MAKDLDKNVLEELNKKVDVLLKKFSEQKGIIDGYVKRERDWKKNKTLNLKKIKDLEFELKKIPSENNCENLKNLHKGFWEGSYGWISF